MFDWVHNNKRLMQVLLGLITLPFLFFGLESYQRLRNVHVATVGDQQITEQEFSRELQQQQERLRGMLGGNFDAAMVDTPEMRSDLLESMISQRLLTHQAIRDNLNVSNEHLREVIATIPAFQVDGKFSSAQYEAALRAQGQTPAMFENAIRRDIMLQQLISALSDSGLASKTVTARIADFRAQQREVAEQQFKVSQYAAQVKVTPETIQAYYDANRTRFQVPEQLRAQYVVLSADALAEAEAIPAEELKKYYQENISRFGSPEQRQASHILIVFKPGASPEEKAKAKEEAKKIADLARKSPASFPELAKKHSGDPGSAARGGDLGYFGRDMMVKPFEEAVFAMKQGEISDLVESDFGYHIIRLTGIRPSSAAPFEKVRPQIEAELKKQSASRRFAQAADTFSNLVYEQSDSLKPVAERFKLTVQEAGWTTREASPAAPLQNPKVLAALFSDDVLKNRHNSEAVEISPGTLLAARVVEHKPASQRPLDEVRAEVSRQLIEKEARELARKEGEARLAALKKGETSATAFGAPRIVSRDKPEGVPRQALTPLFRADASKPPAYVGVELPDGYALYRISKVMTPKVEEAQQKGLQTEIGRLVGAQEFRTYVAALRAAGDVSVNKELLEKKQ